MIDLFEATTETTAQPKWMPTDAEFIKYKERCDEAFARGEPIPKFKWRTEFTYITSPRDALDAAMDAVFKPAFKLISYERVGDARGDTWKFQKWYKSRLKIVQALVEQQSDRPDTGVGVTDALRNRLIRMQRCRPFTTRKVMVWSVKHQDMINHKFNCRIQFCPHCHGRRVMTFFRQFQTRAPETQYSTWTLFIRLPEDVVDPDGMRYEMQTLKLHIQRSLTRSITAPKTIGWFTVGIETERVLRVDMLVQGVDEPRFTKRMLQQCQHVASEREVYADKADVLRRGIAKFLKYRVNDYFETIVGLDYFPYRMRSHYDLQALTVVGQPLRARKRRKPTSKRVRAEKLRTNPARSVE